MKYLIATMMTMLLLMLPYNATAEHQELTQNFKRTWTMGDIIATAVICKDEESIVKVINADMISVEEVLSTVTDLVDEGDCVNLIRPVFFTVQSQFVEYFDFLDRPSVALGVESPVTKGKFLGFVLAPGFWDGPKNIKEISI